MTSEDSPHTNARLPGLVAGTPPDLAGPSGRAGDAAVEQEADQAVEGEGQDAEENQGEERDADEDKEDADPGEARKPTAVRKAMEPTEEERRNHQIGHLPFRVWCVPCVKGRKKDKQHRRTKTGESEDRAVHSMHWDFFFIGDEDFTSAKEESGKTSQPSHPCVVMKERETRILFSYLLPGRGADFEWPTKQLRSDIETMGLKDLPVIFKGDQAKAITWSEVCA